jgi:CSLREA domain-containing protein
MVRSVAARRQSGLIVGLTLVFLLQPVTSRPIEAGTLFLVNSTRDAADLNPGDGACDGAPRDGEQCTLRAAIQEANAAPGSAIGFGIPGPGVKTIVPTNPLPPVTEPVQIDGYTQPGSSRNSRAVGNNAILRVQLDGSGAGPGAHGLTIQASGTSISGLVINRFGGAGILVQGSDNVVAGNFVGTNVQGSQDLGNAAEGVRITGGGNLVGGLDPEARNLISGNDSNGISLSGLLATGNEVQNNYIGTRKSGGAALGNAFNGVGIASAPGNLVGGTIEGADNVISGNNNGIGIGGSGATSNRVEGNRIGTNAAGTDLIPNDQHGVAVSQTIGNTIGGTDAGAGNVISGNGTHGVILSNHGDDNEVSGNLISANDSRGVLIALADGNVIGGGNVIIGNVAGGVAVQFGVGNRIASNQIYANGGLGIDLMAGQQDAFGVTANDQDDPDGGPNRLQNYPVIISATKSNTTGVTTIAGTLNSRPNRNFTIQCFLAEGDPSGHGEGLLFVGQTTIFTDEGGDDGFTCATISLFAGQQVTATARDIASADTSEFADNVTVVAVP